MLHLTDLSRWLMVNTYNHNMKIYFDTFCLCQPILRKTNTANPKARRKATSEKTVDFNHETSDLIKYTKALMLNRREKTT